MLYFSELFGVIFVLFAVENQCAGMKKRPARSEYDRHRAHQVKLLHEFVTFCNGKLVTAFVFRMTRVTLDPDGLYLVDIA